MEISETKRVNHFDAIRAGLASRGLDAMLLLSPINRRYASGFPSSDGAVLITARDNWFFTDSRYIEAACASLGAAAEVLLLTPSKRLTDRLVETLTAAGVRTLGVEEDSLPHSEYLRLEKNLPAELVSAQSLINGLRASKSPAERAAMEKAQRLAEAVYAEILAILRPGLTERQIAAELTYRMLLQGAEGNSFDPIVVAGERGSLPHGVPGDRCIRPGDFVTMDFGCILDGWCSDMTRTVAIGSVTDDMRRVYETVLSAQRAGIAAARAGVPGRAVDAAARRVIEDAGYGEFFGHSFGHSLGLEVHESPNAAPTEERPLPCGAVISAEPGIYLPGRFGVRIEDVLYLTESGAEDLTHAPKDLLIL
jgi:Xaa-Pro aminopeptidase